MENPNLRMRQKNIQDFNRFILLLYSDVNLLEVCSNKLSQLHDYTEATCEDNISSNHPNPQKMYQQKPALRGFSSTRICSSSGCVTSSHEPRCFPEKKHALQSYSHLGMSTLRFRLHGKQVTREHVTCRRTAPPECLCRAPAVSLSLLHSHWLFCAAHTER